MTTREMIDQTVFAVFSLGCLSLQLAFFLDVGGLHL